MKALLPRSLFGQMALLIGVALLFAQLANFALLLNERQKASLAENEGPAITRFVSAVADYSQASAEFRPLVLQDASHRGARFELGATSAVAAGAERREPTEERLEQALASAGIPRREVRAAIDSAPVRERRGPAGARRNVQTLMLSVQLSDGHWFNGRLTTPRRDALLNARLAAGTLLLYLLVLGATLLIATRLARPLRDLTRAAESFGGRNTPELVEPRGPTDLKRAIDAFNAMNRRVVGLLGEKDRMLGAIGHDLRTPLASLRLRAEAMEPADERERMVATIEQMAAILEDILVLARSGQSGEAARQVDVTALVDALVEEYRELGADVSLESLDRHVLSVQPNLIRRAVRNLIDNAVEYAGAASVAVRRAEDWIEIAVRDQGPGIPERELERMKEAFHRVEASRNRETGGSGLGLTIADAIAQGHGGSLQLVNRPEGGLEATLRLPIA